MVSVKVKKSRNNYVGFSCKGHAGSAEYGKDLVCCAISTLVINTINSIEELTNTEFIVNTDETTGYIDFRFNDVVSREASLFIDSMILGIRAIEEDNKKFVRLEIKEV